MVVCVHSIMLFQMTHFHCATRGYKVHADDSSTGYNVVCIMSFKTKEDMTYFMKEEPAHHDLKASVAGKLAKGVLVVDFVSVDPTTMFNS
jgi:hypothetical protein